MAASRPPRFEASFRASTVLSSPKGKTVHRTAIVFGIAVAFGLLHAGDIANAQSKGKEKPVNLLRMATASVEKHPAGDAKSIQAATDEDPSTIAVFKSVKNAPADVVYG